MFYNPAEIMPIEGNGSTVKNRPLTIDNLQPGGAPRWCRADGVQATYIDQTTGGWLPGALVTSPRLYNQDGSGLHSIQVGVITEPTAAAIAERATAYQTFITYTLARGGSVEILAGGTATITANLATLNGLPAISGCPRMRFTQDQD
ncbi:hypothetical protein FSW04_17675 [Baekduia soli]|uniref:Uncharacterized protein n=1 Tax=Baekduia soli TaxID=496014 RepID=A0A5B8U8W3_9ACTN|nr:hypothetical protein [Baekduia soli]QEC49228.1 hypothetical protein FSW04_17675 [Baekduia soli]